MIDKSTLPAAVLQMALHVEHAASTAQHTAVTDLEAASNHNTAAVPVSHLHIPKCGGTSWALMLQHSAKYAHVGHDGLHPLPSPLPSPAPSPGGETCFRETGTVFRPRPGVVRTMMARSPHAHVYSQYLECRYSSWGHWATNSSAGLFHTLSMVDGFRAWLKHFDPTRWNPSHGDFGCYNPRSMQARALTCGGTGVGVDVHHVTSSTYVPDAHVREAIYKMRDHLEFVGLVELFPESWCLLLVRTLGTRPIPRSCNCLERVSIQVPTYSHGVPPHSVSSLPKDVLERIDALTTADTQLYVASMQRFLGEVVDVEERVFKPAGYRLLCDDRLEQLRRSTSYLNVSTNWVWARTNARTLTNAWSHHPKR